MVMKVCITNFFLEHNWVVTSVFFIIIIME